jgi:hypothetical protein
VVCVDASDSREALFGMMQDDTVLCTEDSVPDTGMPAELEVELSRMFTPPMDFKVWIL